MGEALEAGRGVDVAAAERHAPDLLRDGADDGGGVEVRGPRGVLGQRGGEKVEVGLVRAVGLEAAGVVAAHRPGVARATSATTAKVVATASARWRWWGAIVLRLSAGHTAVE